MIRIIIEGSERVKLYFKRAGVCPGSRECEENLIRFNR